MKYEIEWLTDRRTIKNECGVYVDPNALVHLFGRKGDGKNKSYLCLRIFEFIGFNGKGYRYSYDWQMRENGKDCGGSTPVTDSNKLFDTIEECIIDFVKGERLSELPRYWWAELVDEFIYGTKKDWLSKQCQTCRHLVDMVGHSEYFCSYEAECWKANKYYLDKCRGNFHKEYNGDVERVEMEEDKPTKNKQLTQW